MFAFLQQDDMPMAERIAALRGDHLDEARTEQFLLWFMLAVALVLVALFLYRRFAARRAPLGVEAPPEPIAASPAQRPGPAGSWLRSFAQGTRVWVFWEGGAGRVSAAARLETATAREVVLMLEGEGEAPEGPVRLVAPWSGRRGGMVELTALEDLGGGLVKLGLEPGEEVSELRSEGRAIVSLRGAASSPDGGGEAFPVRIIDLTFEGAGILSDRELPCGRLLRLKARVPGRVDSLVLDAEVAWSDAGDSGVHRAGLRLGSVDFEVEARLADLLCEVGRAEGAGLRRPAEETVPGG